MARNCAKSNSNYDRNFQRFIKRVDCLIFCKAVFFERYCRFRMANIKSCLSKLLRLPERSEHCNSITCTSLQQSEGGIEKYVLTGPSLCGKTSLLFEYAFSCAEQGECVLYIAPKPILRLPIFVNGRTVQPCPEDLKRINIVYLANYAELMEYFAKAHLSTMRNSSQSESRHVLIDDFECYFQDKGTRTEQIAQFAKCMAYIIDGFDFWSKNMQLSQKRSILFAETTSSKSWGVDKSALYQHWVSGFIKIQKVGNELFQLQSFEHGQNFGKEFSERNTLQYSFANKAIKVHSGTSALEQVG